MRQITVVLLAVFLTCCAKQGEYPGEYYAGLKKQRSGDYANAIKLYTKAVQKAPKAAKIIIDRAEAYYILNDYKSA